MRFVAAAAAVVVWSILLGLGVVDAAGTASPAPRRVALVIGIDKYDHLPAHAQLRRAASDARALARSFDSLKFDKVFVGENLSRTEFYALWQQLLDYASPNDTVAVYYSGHGIEIDGRNYLIPRDFPPMVYGREERAKRESISVSDLMYDLRPPNPNARKRAKLVLMILDACRDHPLVPPGQKAVAGSGGLATIEPPEGSFVMYAAGTGQTALDSLSTSDLEPNSVYTRKLVPLLMTRGLPLSALARQLRSEVKALAATVGHVQVPAYYDNVENEYCVAGCDAAAPLSASSEPKPAPKPVTESASTASAAPPPPRSAPTFAPVPKTGEVAAAWTTVQSSDNVAVIEGFRKQFGATNPFYDGLAQSKLDALKAAAATEQVRKRDQVSSLDVAPVAPQRAEPPAQPAAEAVVPAPRTAPKTGQPDAHVVAFLAEQESKKKSPPPLTFVRRWAPHSDYTQKIAATRDGLYVVTAGIESADKSVAVIKVWEATTGKLLRSWTAHNVGKLQPSNKSAIRLVNVSALAVSHDGSTIVSVAWDRKLKTWDLATGRLLGSFDIVPRDRDMRDYDRPDFMLLPDGKSIAISTYGFADCGGRYCQDSFYIRELPSGRILKTIPGKFRRGTPTPDSRHIVTIAPGEPQVTKSADGQGMSVSAGEDGGALRILDVASGEWAPDIGRVSVRQDISWVRTSADGRTLVGFLACCDKSLYHIRLWDLATGKQLREVEAPEALRRSIHEPGLTSPDLGYLMSGRAIMSLADGKLVREIPEWLDFNQSAVVAGPSLTITSGYDDDAKQYLVGVWRGSPWP